MNSGKTDDLVLNFSTVTQGHTGRKLIKTGFLSSRSFIFLPVSGIILF